jgi:hypothetical protein
MNWKIKSSPERVEKIRPEPKVYQEHLQILREIKAPEKLIQIAERVASEAQSAAAKK